MKMEIGQLLSWGYFAPVFGAVISEKPGNPELGTL